MPPTTLVVDCGAFSTRAAIVAGEQATLVRDPLSGSALRPSQLSLESGLLGGGSAAERVRDAPATALSTYLGSLRSEAARVASARIDRLTLTVPTSYQLADRRRDLLIAAGEAAGFAEVELLGSATAVLLDAQQSVTFPDDSLVLVCDLGETWSTVLLRVDRHDAVPLAQETSTCGRDLDAQLLDSLRAQARDWLDQRLALPGEEGARVHRQAMEFVRQIKHALCQLDEHAQITGRPAPDAPSYTLTREWLDRFAEPGLRWVGATCRSVVARAAAGWSTAPHIAAHAAPAHSSTLADVRAIVLAGGHARLGRAEPLLRELGRPVIRLDDPELATLRGAVRFAASAPTRRIPADHPRWRVESISWDVPTGRATLERWSVGVGESYRPGDVLGQVRTADERVCELVAPDGGSLLGRHGRVGDVVGPSLLAASTRPASVLAGDPPGKRTELAGSGEWLLTADRRALAECAATGELVRVYSLPDGGLLRQFRPVVEGPGEGRLFVRPDGELALVRWERTGSFSVWDVRTGALTTTFKEQGPPSSVLVNESEWRLRTDGEDAGSAGRYRRTVTAVWDLHSGRRLEKSADAAHRPPGYEARSQCDRLAEAAASPDGRLRVVPVLGRAGPTGISVRMAVSEQELFRAEHAPVARVRVAFTADGQFLLAARESPQASHVDVWEL